MSVEKSIPLEASMLNLAAKDMPIGLQTEINIKKTPTRVLHFSDGTLEEYSTDEEEGTDEVDNKNKQLIDPSTLNWGNWIFHHMSSKGNSALAACDYLGENVAYYLGITTPKYQYEIEEHERALKEEKAEKEKLAEQMVGWSSDQNSEVVSNLSTALHAPDDVSIQREMYNLQEFPKKFQSKYTAINHGDGSNIINNPLCTSFSHPKHAKVVIKNNLHGDKILTKYLPQSSHSPHTSSTSSSPVSSCPPSPSAEEARHLLSKIHRPEKAENSTWV